MDLEFFQKLCNQRANGEKTELEFLKDMRGAFESHEPGSRKGMRQKEILLFLYERLIQMLEENEPAERETLAQEIEDWLKNPGKAPVEKTPEQIEP